MSKTIAITTKTQPPWAIAHRGYSALYPENTFAAFDAALAEDIQAMELDLQLTFDGTPVVYHDRTLHKLIPGLKRVRHMDLRDLRRLDSGAWFQPPCPGQHIPLLEEVLDRYGCRTRLLLEIKLREGPNGGARLRKLMKRTLELVEQKGLTERVYLLSFDLDLLCYGHRLYPGVRFVWNQDYPQFDKNAAFLFAYSVRVSQVQQSFVQTAHDHGKPVLTFTCNRPPQLAKALRCGVNGIMSDDPGWLTTALGRSHST